LIRDNKIITWTNNSLTEDIQPTMVLLEKITQRTTDQERTCSPIEVTADLMVIMDLKVTNPISMLP